MEKDLVLGRGIRERIKERLDFIKEQDKISEYQRDKESEKRTAFYNNLKIYLNKVITDSDIKKLFSNVTDIAYFLVTDLERVEERCSTLADTANGLGYDGELVFVFKNDISKTDRTVATIYEAQDFAMRLYDDRLGSGNLVTIGSIRETFEKGLARILDGLDNK